MRNLNPLNEGIIGSILKYSIKQGYKAGKKGLKSLKNRVDLKYGDLDNVDVSDISSDFDEDEDISDIDF